MTSQHINLTQFNPNGNISSDRMKIEGRGSLRLVRGRLDHISSPIQNANLTLEAQIIEINTTRKNRDTFKDLKNTTFDYGKCSADESNKTTFIIQGRHN